MSRYVLASNPIVGHVSPVIAIAGHLASRGHDVTVVTGSRFTDAIEAVGAEAHPLTGSADYDDRDIDVQAPERDRYSGVRRLRYDVESVFVAPMPDQYHTLQFVIDETCPDAVLVENAFAGVLPLLLDDPARRPPVYGLGVLPLSQVSRDTAPFGLGLAPWATTTGRIRNSLLNAAVTKGVFGPTQKLANRLLAELGRPPIHEFVLDLSRYPDRFLQLTVPEFEYPRSDISANVRFVGPVLPAAPATMPLPDWWNDLDGSRPIVHVTQGTIDNKDPNRLIRPTIDALADRDVLVVVSTGGRPVADLGELPANVRAAAFLPYDALLPRLDVMVTNAGYGGVQFALSHGVPIVAAGDTEDKPDVSARVAWSGVGVNLKTGRPDASSIARAVNAVLSDPTYATRARALASRIAEYDALETIERELAAAPYVARSLHA